MTPDQLKAKWDNRFADNDTFEIDEQDLREFNDDVAAQLKRGPNEQSGGPFFVRWFATTQKQGDTDSCLEDIPARLLCLWCQVHVELGPEAGTWVPIYNGSAAAGAPQVYQDGRFRAGVTVPYKWVRADSQEAADAAVELFTAQKVGGYFGPANAAHPVSLVRYTLDGVTQFYTAVRDMLPPGIPAPTSGDDANWKRTTRPAPVTSLAYQRFTPEQLRTAVQAGTLPEGQHIRVSRPSSGDVLLDVLNTEQLSPEGYLESQADGSYTRVRYDLATDTTSAILYGYDDTALRQQVQQVEGDVTQLEADSVRQDGEIDALQLFNEAQALLVRGSRRLAYASLADAIQAAVAPDTVEALTGSTTGTVVLKNGLSYATGGRAVDWRVITDDGAAVQALVTGNSGPFDENGSQLAIGGAGTNLRIAKALYTGASQLYAVLLSAAASVTHTGELFGYGGSQTVVQVAGGTFRHLSGRIECNGSYGFVMPSAGLMEITCETPITFNFRALVKQDAGKIVLRGGAKFLPGNGYALSIIAQVGGGGELWLQQGVYDDTGSPSQYAVLLYNGVLHVGADAQLVRGVGGTGTVYLHGAATIGGNADTVTVVRVDRGGGADLSGYYTKSESESRYALLESLAPLAYAATIALDFNLASIQTLALNGSCTFLACLNKAPLRTKEVYLTNTAASAVALAYPSAWKFAGIAGPTSLAAGKSAILTLRCLGTTETEIWAACVATM